MTRIGHGYDAHRLTPGRKLILGGVEIPFERGLLGHSDADAAAHALMDALLDIAEIAKADPEALHRAPETTPVGRPDEVAAARKPVIIYGGNSD